MSEETCTPNGMLAGSDETAEPAVTTPAVCFHNVTFAYQTIPILENVAFSVQERDFVSIIGPNGGGKSTMMKLMLGLLKPDRGEVRVFGTSPARARQRIGYTPQHTLFDPQFPVTVMDVTLMGRLERHWGACEPDLLLLDEPTAGIDAMVENKLLDVLRELKQRMTILMVSHDLEFVSSMVETVICVNRQVRVHPTSAISGSLVEEMYGGSLRLVRHDHFQPEKGHRHD
jgi:zinc transport system ATP-binding protein